MEIPFIGGAYTGRVTNINAQSCVNLFPVIDQQDAKGTVALYGTPGLKSFSILESGLVKCVRATYALGEFLYAIVNANVYRIASDGGSTLLGAISTSSGFVSITDNGIQILIVDGSGYVITVSTGVLAEIADTDFPYSSFATFQDGYFIVVEKDTGRIWISGLYDGTSWDALDFTTAEGRPDNSVAVLSNTHDLWIFGEKSVEVYYNSGDSDTPFQRISGALIDSGIGAIGSAIKLNGVLYWLSDKGQVCRNNGYQPSVISTPHIDYQVSTYETMDDAIGFPYTIDGHHFYVLQFPSANKTWVFDTTTNYWHEWQSYNNQTTWGRHRANCSAYFNRKYIVGDYENGTLYTLDMDTYTDNLNAIRRIRATQTINKERLNVLFHRLEIEFEAGKGLTEGQGSAPQAMLDWSDDGGHTWSNEHWVDIGAIGKYKQRAIWRRLGKSRNRVFRMTVSDPIKWVLLTAYADLETCRS
ncbi:MAG TPA: hypothetical protein ACFYD4_03325 [Candidatus Wunengus sp. YC61]|uniref:hypothetical protein n=1 Tax=Candidatus Wunengus sp. YC61 TaxID=3367698 RepID=UPI004026A3F9